MMRCWFVAGFQLILNLAPDIEVVAHRRRPAALDVIAVHHPDVVLLDIRMPGMDGLSILPNCGSSRIDRSSPC